MSETSTQQKRRPENEQQVRQAKLQNEDEVNKALKYLARLNETYNAYLREYAAKAQLIDLLKNTKLEHFNVSEIIIHNTRYGKYRRLTKPLPLCD
ncbi:hypothetical protein PVAND_009580 [Polypedilum vanderplanki]|uniref:Uncharacterized protein n=1 Tax=Polypedilum vanderplanki TaxID=319348 RepID=A0A9J6CCZ5_POLVA|nr:hypothetical protein PVAND_009580 [Polypedilum vanderplanki]